MAVNTIANVFILSEQVMSASFHSQTAVVQYAPSSLSIEVFSSCSHHDLKTEIQVKGIYTTKVRRIVLLRELLEIKPYGKNIYLSFLFVYLFFSGSSVQCEESCGEY